jgi:hypothetical protein
MRSDSPVEAPGSGLPPPNGHPNRGVGLPVKIGSGLRFTKASDPDGERGLTRVDPSIAAVVGEWYLSARSFPHDARIVAAYGHLQSETDRLFNVLVRSGGPGVVRVVFTRCGQPYAGDRELIAAVRAQRILEIPTAAVAGHRIHPVFGCGLGGAFDRFRAIHDLIGHAWLGHGFDLDGEYAAWRAQDRLHRGPARWALATELCGVNSARWLTGEPPDLKAMLLEPGMLDRTKWQPAAAVSS